MVHRPVQECTSEDQPEPLVGLPRAGVRTRLARFQGLEWLGFSRLGVGATHR